MIFVLCDMLGVMVVCNIMVVNYYVLEGYCEIMFDNVWVLVCNLFGEEGSGFVFV